MSSAPQPRVAALALAVGLVLADSSIVVLALPQIYRELDTSVTGVTWVLVSFNLVMALTAVFAALTARRDSPHPFRRPVLPPRQRERTGDGRNPRGEQPLWCWFIDRNSPDAS